MDEHVSVIENYMADVNARKFKVEPELFEKFQRNVLERLKWFVQRKVRMEELKVQPVDERLVQVVQEVELQLEMLEEELKTARKEIPSKLQELAQTYWGKADQSKLTQAGNRQEEDFMNEPRTSPMRLAELERLCNEHKLLVEELSHSVPTTNKTLRETILAVKSGEVLGISEVEEILAESTELNTEITEKTTSEKSQRVEFTEQLPKHYRFAKQLARSISTANGKRQRPEEANHNIAPPKRTIASSSESLDELPSPNTTLPPPPSFFDESKKNLVLQPISQNSNTPQKRMTPSKRVPRSLKKTPRSALREAAAGLRV